jgi:hypothetical protein
LITIPVNSSDFNIPHILNITNCTPWRISGLAGEDGQRDDPFPSVVQPALEYRNDDSTTTAVPASGDCDHLVHMYTDGSRTVLPRVFRRNTQTTFDVQPANEVAAPLRADIPATVVDQPTVESTFEDDEESLSFRPETPPFPACKVRYLPWDVWFRLFGRKSRAVSDTEKICWLNHWIQLAIFTIYALMYFLNNFKLHGFDVEHCVPVSFPSLVFYLLEIDGKLIPTSLVEVVLYSPRNLKVLDEVTNKLLGKKFGAIANKIPQVVYIKSLDDRQKYRNEIMHIVRRYLSDLNPIFLSYWKSSFENLEFPSPDCDEFVKVAKELLTKLEKSDASSVARKGARR